MSSITLTTDFGLDDWFVGSMKGVILNIAPKARIIDLTHGIPSGGLRAGAFALKASYAFFPRGTIHVVVIDPGVGSERRAIAVQTTDFTFVGPDNGVLSWALEQEQVKGIYRLENEEYFVQPLSQTFHGRDIFAPVAAHLSRRVALRRIGPPMKDYERLEWPEPISSPGKTVGEVIYIDRFGNAITNLDNSLVAEKGPGRIKIHGSQTIPIGAFYQASPVGKPVAVPGSSGYLEVAINGGNAARKLKLKIRSRIILG